MVALSNPFSGDGPMAGYKWEALWQDQGVFWGAFLYTVKISVGALILAVALGIIFGVMASSRNKFLTGLARVYVEFFQNTPLLIQIFFVYFGLPLFGIVLEVSTIGILCVGIYHGAYVAEVIRTGIVAVPKGQSEAALSQGLSYLKTMREIILPQAWRYFLPPFTNQVVSLIKNTSLVALVAGPDIMFMANSWSGYNLYYGPAFIFAGLLYFILCFPLARLASRFEAKNKNAY
nr:amino acid ABC transporter permease [Enterococcus timonensis]